MSMFVMNEGKLYTFSEFLMLESLGPVPIKFGTNYLQLDNRQRFEQDNYTNTFFKVGEYFYSVLMSSGGEIGFGVSSTFSTNLKDYGDDCRKIFSALKVLNGFIYVTLEIAKARKTKKLQFSAASEGLGYIYDGIMENSVFLKKMEESGRKYIGKNGKLHVFEVI